MSSSSIDLIFGFPVIFWWRMTTLGHYLEWLTFRLLQSSPLCLDGLAVSGSHCSQVAPPLQRGLAVGSLLSVCLSLLLDWRHSQVFIPRWEALFILFLEGSFSSTWYRHESGNKGVQAASVWCAKMLRTENNRFYCSFYVTFIWMHLSCTTWTSMW